MRPYDWCKRNLAGTLAVNPIPAFFVPIALSENDFTNYGINQILFDRCRISALCSVQLADGLNERLRAWIAAARERDFEYDAN